ncbi:MAG: thiamine-phosphate kinase [Opitutaceae bacterium]
MHPFTRRRQDSVAALGEVRLIAAIRRWLGDTSPRAPFGIGDDCAVLPPAAGRGLVTVDPVIHGRHFDDTVPPEAVGAKLLKRNLSDIAAMGGKPRAAVLAVTLDARVRVRWLERFYRGLAAAARRHGVTVVGGDIAEAPRVLAASLTLLGTAAGTRVLTRTGARKGDWIYVTGELGNSRASGHHHAFTPRLAEGAWLARRKAVRSMMDLSDGLAKDLAALTPSGTAPDLDFSLLPLRAGASIRSALAEGEDYELVLSVASRADRAALESSWRRRFPRVRLTCIGRFCPVTRRQSGPRFLSSLNGYEHFR